MAMIEKAEDPQYLRKQYADTSNLQARRGLYEFVFPKQDIVGDVFRALNLQGTEALLDVGCGDGAALLRLRRRGHIGRLIGVDMSKGMLAEAQEQQRIQQGESSIELVVASADALPFGHRKFDVVSSFFMLYHMPDINRAIGEWKRVVTQNGHVAIATNSRLSRPKMQHFKAVLAKNLHSTVPLSFTSRFDVENGEGCLRSLFKMVEHYVLKGEIRLTNPQPYLRALTSVRDAIEPLPTEDQWDNALNMIQNEINDEIKNNGYFTDQTIAGFFICSTD